MTQYIIVVVILVLFYSNLDCGLGHSKSRKRQFAVLPMKNRTSNISFLCSRDVVSPQESSLEKERKTEKLKEEDCNGPVLIYIRHECFVAQRSLWHEKQQSSPL